MDPASFLHTVSVAAIPVVFAITVHEVAHGWVARHFGDRTAESLGRLSLNPIRHVDPVGTVLVPALLLLLPGNFRSDGRSQCSSMRNMRNPRANMVCRGRPGRQYRDGDHLGIPHDVPSAWRSGLQACGSRRCRPMASSST
jgi:hypothetical protein